MGRVTSVVYYLGHVLVGSWDDSKTTRVAIQKIGCAVIVILVILTLAICLLARDSTTRRIIRINYEIAILSAHTILLVIVDLSAVSMGQDEVLCKVMSVLLHLFFLASFWLLLLESLHLHGLCRRKKEGLFSQWQNVLVGWGVPIVLVAFVAAFLHAEYINVYTCFLPINTVLFYLQLVPNSLLSLSSAIIVLISHNHLSQLSKEDRAQMVVADLMKKSLILIIPLSLAHWVVAVFAVRYLDLVLHTTFSALTFILAICILYFHCFRNPEVIAWFYETDNQVSPDVALKDKKGSGGSGFDYDHLRVSPSDLHLHRPESAFTLDTDDVIMPHTPHYQEHVKFKASREWRNNLQLSMETPSTI